MSEIAEIVGAVLIIAGAFFFVVGAVGIYRMPDVFTRMHAAGISDTVGAGLLIVGMMFFGGLTLVTVKLAIILGIVIFTSPVATHALAQAALHAGVEPILKSKTILRGPGVPPEAKAPPGRSGKSPKSAKPRAMRAGTGGSKKRRKRS
jgi:multicomponent Na+:H+ antiporter subunit G